MLNKTPDLDALIIGFLDTKTGTIKYCFKVSIDCNFFVLIFFYYNICYYLLFSILKIYG